MMLRCFLGKLFGPTAKGYAFKVLSSNVRGALILWQLIMWYNPRTRTVIFTPDPTLINSFSDPVKIMTNYINMVCVYVPLQVYVQPCINIMAQNVNMD